MNLDAIRCPRCDEGMESFLRRGPGRSAVTADMCEQCGGVWLDGKEVAEAYPAFAGLADRIAGAAPGGGDVRGIRACPRCAAVPVTFGFFELALDVCLECHGLWVDGDELADLARTGDRADGLPAPVASERGYRENAASAVRSGRVACKRCRAEVELANVEPTSVGPMCGGCAAAFRDERLDAELADYRPPTNPVVDFSFLGDVAEALPVFLGAALAAHGSCARCGCSSASRCRH
jgi:Zn-finger nucleic acid-binding protein